MLLVNLISRKGIKTQTKELISVKISADHSLLTALKFAWKRMHPKVIFLVIQVFPGYKCQVIQVRQQERLVIFFRKGNFVRVL